MVEMLLDRGADVNARSYNKRSQYGICMRSALREASEGGYKDVVKMLLDRGADVNVQDEEGNALQAASRVGDEELVQMLLDRGANVNARSKWGTALCEASTWGSCNVVPMLLDRGARISIGRDRMLRRAVWHGHPDIVQMLLNGMNAEDFDNEWRMASSSSDPTDHKIMELLQTHDFPFRHKPSVTEEA